MEPIERRFVALNSPTAGRNGAGYHPCQGIYHLRAGSKPKTAAIATHYNVDFSAVAGLYRMLILSFGATEPSFAIAFSHL